VGHEGVLGSLHLGHIVALGEQVAVHVHRYHDRRMAEPLLQDLGREFEPAVRLAIDASRREEVAVRVRSLLLPDRAAVLLLLAASVRR